MNQSKTKKNKLYRGQWAGLSATYIAGMLGISPKRTRKLLRDKLSILQKDELSRKDIGILIYDFYKNEIATKDTTNTGKPKLWFTPDIF